MSCIAQHFTKSNLGLFLGILNVKLFHTLSCLEFCSGKETIPWLVIVIVASSISQSSEIENSIWKFKDEIAFQVTKLVKNQSKFITKCQCSCYKKCPIIITSFVIHFGCITFGTFPMRITKIEHCGVLAAPPTGLYRAGIAVIHRNSILRELKAS